MREESEWGEEGEEYGEELDAESIPPKKRSKSTPDTLKGFLKDQIKEQLISLLEDFAGKHSIVREDLQDRFDVAKDSVKKMVNAVRKEIHEISSEPAWRNHWNDEGHIPDYSRVKDRLESLLSKGHADEVVALGKELLKAGIEQVEMSHDEGETGNEISSCLEVVFRALSQSSLPAVQQMLWVIDAELVDEYELCYGSESFWKKKQKASAWSARQQRADELHLDTGWFTHRCRRRHNDVLRHRYDHSGERLERAGNGRRLEVLHAHHPKRNNDRKQRDCRNRSQFHDMFHLASSHRDDGGGGGCQHSRSQSKWDFSRNELRSSAKRWSYRSKDRNRQF